MNDHILVTNISSVCVIIDSITVKVVYLAKSCTELELEATTSVAESLTNRSAIILFQLTTLTVEAQRYNRGNRHKHFTEDVITTQTQTTSQKQDIYATWTRDINHFTETRHLRHLARRHKAIPDTRHLRHLDKRHETIHRHTTRLCHLDKRQEPHHCIKEDEISYEKTNICHASKTTESTYTI